ncbi:MAG TPA: translation initiation factor IF-3 [Candidatus Dojkabacteria bacterium]|nr:translation initiation factor IF-3 [Candidatus Dojkabacteria bacterium]
MEFKKTFKRPYNNNNGYNRNNGSYNRGNADKKQYGPRRNEFIRVPQVMVIGDQGENLGVMKTDEAIKLAQSKGLDLVEVGATVNPPVCKIIDYAKYVYELNKKQRKNKNKAKDMKEFKFSPVIDIGDIELRVRRSKEFIDKGHNVRLTMVRKGRQTHELAIQVFNDILTNFEGYSTIEPEKKVEGKTIFITFKANGKAKN